MPSRYDDVIRTQQLFVLMCLPGPVLASDWIMPNYNESLHVSLTTAVQSCDLKYCSECVEKGWSPRTQCKDVPGVSQGPLSVYTTVELVDAAAGSILADNMSSAGNSTARRRKR